MKYCNKIILGIIFGILLLVNAAYASDDVKIIINNQELHTVDKPIIVEGRTMLPVRAIGEALGCEVFWFGPKKTANIKNDSTIISMQIKNKNITKQKVTSGQNMLLQTDVAPILVNDRMYAPVRALAESLDAIAGWDSVTRSVIIVYDTTLKYAGNYSVSTYAGTGERKKHDSNLLTMSFISPESIDISENGDVYISDSGLIRKLSGGKSSTMEIEPAYITASVARCNNDEVYILTNEFQNDDGIKYYGIAKLGNSGAQGLFVTEAAYSKIPDFDVSRDGKIYAIYDNVGAGQNYLAEIDKDTGDVKYIKEIDSGIKALTVDDNGNIFLANTVKGSIYFYDTAASDLRLFAGRDNCLKFVDGPNPMFFEPRKLDFKDGYLYVLDYNIVRRVSVNSANSATFSETIAGKVSAEQNPVTENGKASEVVFAPSYLMDIAVGNEGILLTDPKNSQIRMIK